MTTQQTAKLSVSAFHVFMNHTANGNCEADKVSLNSLELKQAYFSDPQTSKLAVLRAKLHS